MPTLKEAIRNRDLLTVKRLLDNNADIEAIYPGEQHTPLMFASMEGDLESVKLLLKEKAEINNMNSDGVTALMLASAFGHSDIVEGLLDQKNVDITLQDYNGDTALDLALLSDNWDANRHEIIEKFHVKNLIDQQKSMRNHPKVMREFYKNYYEGYTNRLFIYLNLFGEKIPQEIKVIITNFLFYKEETEKFVHFEYKFKEKRLSLKEAKLKEKLHQADETKESESIDKKAIAAASHKMLLD